MTPNPLPAPPSQQPTKKQSNVAVYLIVGVVVLFGCCGVGGILSAIAIPNFIKYQARAKQAECKANLKALYTAEQAYFADHGAYSDDLDAVGFRVHNNLYTYLLGDAVVKATHPSVARQGVLDAAPAALLASLGVRDGGFTAGCVGSIDNDPAVDVWTISSEDRVIEGQRVPAGVPHNDVSDLDF
jgi:type II secretory pathway pseudopilin PulG